MVWMWFLVFSLLSLSCMAMTMAMTVANLLQLYFLWSKMLREDAAAQAAAEKDGGRGLTVEELERLEERKVGVGGGGECVVCLGEMEEGQAARVLPGCRHAFHRSCADAWLQAHPTCPLCRERLHTPPPLPPNPTPSPSPSPSPLVAPDTVY